jgi:hypothetical protein
MRRKPLPDFVQVAIQWTIAWALGGAVLGVLLMLGSALPFVHSWKSSILGHWLGIPVLGAGAAAAGLGVGFLYAFLMVLTADLREAYDAPGLWGTARPYVFCGGAAGLIPGLLVGGVGGALFFAVLGAGTAAALNWGSIRSEADQKRARTRPQTPAGQRRSQAR